MDNAAIMAQQQQLLLQQQQVAHAQAQVAAAARQQQLAQQQHQLAQPGGAPPQSQPPPQQQMQLQQLAMQQALQQQQQQLILQQHQQQLAYQQAAQRQAHLAAQQRAVQLQAQMQYRPMQPGLQQVTQHQQAVRPPLQQAAAYPGAYGMMAATRPAAAAPLQPTPAAPQKQAHELVLQLGRVKKIVKQASDVKAVANDANFAIARATELFIEAMAAKSAKRTLADQRILLAYNDVAATVHDWIALDFLADVVPRKIPASALLRQLQEQQLLQQAEAASNGYAAAKSEAADVKSEEPVKVEGDGVAPMSAEADGNAGVKVEADGNGQTAGITPPAPADQPPIATPSVPSASHTVANGGDVKVVPPMVEQPGTANAPPARLGDI